MDKLIRKVLRENLLLEYGGYVPIFEDLIDYIVPIIISKIKSGEDRIYINRELLKKFGIDNKIQYISIDMFTNDKMMARGYAKSSPSDLLRLDDNSIDGNLKSSNPLFAYKVHLNKPYCSDENELKILLQHELTHLYHSSLKYKDINSDNFEYLDSKFKDSVKFYNASFTGNHKYGKVLQSFCKYLTYYLTDAELNAYISQFYKELENEMTRLSNEMDENGYIDYEGKHVKFISCVKNYGIVPPNSQIFGIYENLSKLIYVIDNHEEIAETIYEFVISTKFLIGRYIKNITEKSNKDDVIRHIIQQLRIYLAYIGKKLRKCYRYCAYNILNKSNKEYLHNSSIRNFNKKLSLK